MEMFGKRRERLHHLIDLARGCHCWSRTKLARALNRSSTRLYPDTDNPKLDLLVALADVLEWPVDAVAEYVWAGVMPETGFDPAPGSDDEYDALLDQTRQAFREGKYAETVKLARRLLSLAQTPTQRAVALDKQAIAWDAMGRFTKAKDIRHRAMLEQPVSIDVRMMLKGNHAATLAALSEYASAQGIAHRIIDWFGENPPQTELLRMVFAFAYYVRGNASQCLIPAEPSLGKHHAQDAKVDLGISARMHEQLADEYDKPELLAIANTCRAGIVVSEVELGTRGLENAISMLMDGLPESVAVGEEDLLGDWIESYGWWAILGGELAVRHLHGSSLQHATAVFSSKALEIADIISNWEFRARALRIQFASHEKLRRETGLRLEFQVDEDVLRIISGVIGRFPAFRSLGWKMLKEAKVVGDESAL